MRKKKIKTWVKVLGLLILFTFICFLIKQRINTLNNIANECDKEKGYTCSSYEIQEYRRGK